MKLLLLLPLFCFLTACARPNYVSKEDQKKNNVAVPEACAQSFSNTSLCAKITWSQEPTSSQAGEFILSLEGDTTIFDELITILWMPSMGHGSAPVKIKRLNSQEFLIYNVYFIMPGDWEIRMSLKKDGVVLGQLHIPLMVP